MSLTLLFLGDVYGKPGRAVIKEHLSALRAQHEIHAVVCNAENAAGGFGITESTAQELYDAGVDIITLGNHTWDKPDTPELLQRERKMLRPYNYPPQTPGKGFRVYDIGDKKIAVLNLMGRLFMENGLDCPFQASRALMQEYTLGSDYDALVVDIHAEATSEKMCLAHIWDGKASLVVGTHTHIPTADTRVLEGGTAYQTDAGMCGIYESSLGVAFADALHRFERKGKRHATPAKGEPTLSGVLVKVGANGLASAVKPLRIGGTLQQAL